MASSFFFVDTYAGHVFVVNGDLSKLACDAWMIPTDDKLSLEPNWNVTDVIKVLRIHL